MVDKIWLLTVSEFWEGDPSRTVSAFKNFDDANTAFQALVSKSRAAYEEAFGEDAKVDANMCESRLTFECWKDDDYCAYSVVVSLEKLIVKQKEDK